MSGEMHNLTLLVGKLAGTLESHIASVERDRNERAGDRVESASYRQEVRHALNNLTMKVNAVEPLAVRVAAIEPAVEDYKTIRIKIGAAIIVAGGVWSMLAGGVFYFGSEIKEMILRLFRVS